MSDIELDSEPDPGPEASRSRWAPISVNRRLVLDGLQFAKKVPLYPVEKTIDLAEVAALRSAASPRISWAIIFVKAYALAAQNHQPLRRAYIRWPWPHFVEDLHSTAMVVVDRQYRGESRICWARFLHPELRSLKHMQHRLNHYQTRPVEVIFDKQILLGRLPTALRRLIYWWNLTVGGSKRGKRMGTFSMSTLAGQGVLNRDHQTFLTTSLTYGPLDLEGRALVTLLCDHRVVDGVIAARALADLEGVLNGPIAEELRSLQAGQAAA